MTCSEFSCPSAAVRRMFGGLALSFVVLALGSPSAQARQRPAPQTPPLAMAGGISVSTCDAPLQSPSRPEFSAQLPCLEAWVKLEHVSKKHTFRFLWYDPDGNLYTSTPKGESFQPEATRSGYHPAVWLRHRLIVRTEQASFLVGSWKVVVWLDDAHLAETRFELQSPDRLLEQGLFDAKRLYRELQYNKAVESLIQVVNTSSHRRVIAEAYWWLALCGNALGNADMVRQSLEELLEMEQTFSVDPAEAEEAGGAAVRETLEATRRERFPDLYLKTSFPPEVDLADASTAPVIRAPWPLWKKILIYGGIPVVAGAGALLLAGGGNESASLPPLQANASIANASDPKIECVPFTGSASSVTRTFQVDVQGGSGDYVINWDFNRGLGNAQVQPPTASNVRQQTVRYEIDNVNDLGSYIVVVEIGDRNEPQLGSVRDALVLIINFPQICQN